MNEKQAKALRKVVGAQRQDDTTYVAADVNPTTALVNPNCKRGHYRRLKRAVMQRLK